MYNLLTIDELIRYEHYYLEEGDNCTYLMEYVPKSRDHVESLIMNFKKKMDREGKPDWGYKKKAIEQIADILQESVPAFEEPDTILVPIPPSKRKDHPMYDDRGIRLLNLFAQKRQHADVREIISVLESIDASHDLENRPAPDAIRANLVVDENLCTNSKPKIILVDDVITAGSHFKACQSILQPFFPDSIISGLFIARRAVRNFQFRLP
ncbi:MAG: hypothetical protein WAZ36_09905 [Sediminibacterium sp.]